MQVEWLELRKFDPQLTEQGKKQALKLGKYLSSVQGVKRYIFMHRLTESTRCDSPRAFHTCDAVDNPPPSHAAPSSSPRP